MQNKIIAFAAQNIPVQSASIEEHYDRAHLERVLHANYAVEDHEHFYKVLELIDEKRHGAILTVQDMGRLVVPVVELLSKSHRIDPNQINHTFHYLLSEGAPEHVLRKVEQFVLLRNYRLRVRGHLPE